MQWPADFGQGLIGGRGIQNQMQKSQVATQNKAPIQNSIGNFDKLNLNQLQRRAEKNFDLIN